jgi:hydroxyacylglutathione hydrolase
MSLSFTELSPRLWVAQSRGLKMNTGAFISASEACLIDPGLFPDEIEDIRRLVEEQEARPGFIVLTHSHWDHIVGPEHFMGVRVIAQAEYVAFTRKNAAELVKPLAMWEEHVGLKRDKPFVIPQPDETFDETTSMRVGGIILRLEHVPGHAADQLAIRCEDTGAVWVSDILSDIEIPYVSDNLAAYERTLEKVAAWDIRALVPGHGAWTTGRREIRKRIDQDRRYLAELRERVERALREERTIEETVQACADMEIRRPDLNAESHVLNVESVYMELGGEGNPKKKGWTKDFFAEDD